jgi:Xaa-Pro aminopeptidase
MRLAAAATRARVEARVGLWRARKSSRALRVCLMLLAHALAQSVMAQASPIAAVPTLQARRLRAMEMAGSGVLLVRSTPGIMRAAENGLRQDPAFLYLTGLPNAIGALLVLDITKRETWLFVPDAGRLGGFAALMQSPAAYVVPGAATATALGLDHVVTWREFTSFMDRRLAEEPTLVLRGPFSSTNLTSRPAVLTGVDADALWEHSLRTRWPTATVAEGPDAEDLRAIKDDEEQSRLRTVAKSSAAALLDGMRGVRPGRRQREAELDVLASCVTHGASGVSFWPWIMSGPNAVIVTAIQSLGDANFADRVMQAGELVRVDIGCRQAHYEGDVGRTVPVSGTFTDAQREAWDMFVRAYDAALAEMKPGKTASEIFAVWRSDMAKRRPRLRSAFARRVADVALSADGGRFWEIHGVGLASAEGNVDTLRTGQVVAFEPMLTVDGVGLYLEDMVLITATGAEVLTTGLPYLAAEIEAVMRGRAARLPGRRRAN